jgi:hypothetical protein
MTDQERDEMIEHIFVLQSRMFGMMIGGTIGMAVGVIAWLIF